MSKLPSRFLGSLHSYARWLSDDPDPGGLLRPLPEEPMRMWPISTRVNRPENDDPSLLDPIELFCGLVKHSLSRRAVADAMNRNDRANSPDRHL
jgi:hypothetical protein